MSSNSLTAVTTPLSPQGLDQIIATFGDIFAYVGADHLLDRRWQRHSLKYVALAFPMKLSWDPSRTVTQINCHKLLTGVFADVFRRIQSEGLQNQITTFGGCFSFRPQRTGTKLSAHA